MIYMIYKTINKVVNVSKSLELQTSTHVNALQDSLELTGKMKNFDLKSKQNNIKQTNRML